jgi:hypothetical protein
MTDSIKNIKFIYIGNTQTKQKIGDYLSDFDHSVYDIISKMYDKINVLSNNKEVVKFGSANNQDTYVLINSNTKVLYLMITAQTYKKEFVVELFSELEKNAIHLLTDSVGLLNDSGKRNLKDIVKNYENKKNVMQDLNSDINEVKIELQENIRKQLSNNESSEKLSDNASKLKDQANIFKNDSNKLKRITCWQNCKWTIILVVVFLVLILIIVVPIVVTGSKVIPTGGDSGNDNTKNTTTLRFLTDTD